MNAVPAALLAVGSFAAMELVSYLMHRYVMHGFGMPWHRSHHAPPAGRFERNDLFPASFSLFGIACFALASMGPKVAPLFWVGVGVTAYGACYLFVHEIYIHRRLSVSFVRGRYFEWLRDAHHAHHAVGGEPYGMLLPLLRGQASPDRDLGSQPLARGRPALGRSRTRATRARL
jgi:beta-carotene 3-hydroxylase